MKYDLNWLVCFDIPADPHTSEPKKRQVIAAFRYPFEADDFINILPAETRNRFYKIREL